MLFKETDQFINAYDTLRKPSTCGPDKDICRLNKERLPEYISILITNILQKIEEIQEKDKVPTIMLKMTPTELCCRENEEGNGHILDLMCTFELLENKNLEILGDTYVLPQSAHSTLDTFNGKSTTSITWKRY